MENMDKLKYQEMMVIADGGTREKVTRKLLEGMKIGGH